MQLRSSKFSLITHDYYFPYHDINVDDCVTQHREYLLPKFEYVSSRDKLLLQPTPDLKRCTKCILPETMPYITFNPDGVCNYCEGYILSNVPKPVSVLESLVKPFRRNGARDCIVPFSGGRDSCYGLHLVVEELG